MIFLLPSLEACPELVEGGAAKELFYPLLGGKEETYPAFPGQLEDTFPLCAAKRRGGFPRAGGPGTHPGPPGHPSREGIGKVPSKEGCRVAVGWVSSERRVRNPPRPCGLPLPRGDRTFFTPLLGGVPRERRGGFPSWRYARNPPRPSGPPLPRGDGGFVIPRRRPAAGGPASGRWGGGSFRSFCAGGGPGR